MRTPILVFVAAFVAIAALAAGCSSSTQQLFAPGTPAPSTPTPVPTPTPTVAPACTPSPSSPFTFAPKCLSFQSTTAAQTFTASESGFNGTISVGAKSTCLTNPPNQPPLGLASISPNSGPSGQVFSVTPGVLNNVVQAGYCSFIISDGKNSAQYQIEIDSTIVIIQSKEHRVK